VIIGLKYLCSVEIHENCRGGEDGVVYGLGYSPLDFPHLNFRLIGVRSLSSHFANQEGKIGNVQIVPHIVNKIDEVSLILGQPHGVVRICLAMKPYKTNKLVSF
jgi:hypothetical protein